MYRICIAVASLIVIGAAGCSSADGAAAIQAQFAEDSAAWEALDIDDFNIRYAARSGVSVTSGTLEIAVEGGEVVLCTTAGDLERTVSSETVCDQPESNPVSFMVALLGSVDLDHLEWSVNDRWHFIDRIVHDDPSTEGEDLVLTVVRFNSATSGEAYWREHGPPDYRIVYSMQNHNGMGGSTDDGIFDVTVRDGKVIDCVAEMNFRPSQEGCRPPIADPVALLFSLLSRFNADHLTVTYHPEWQFPTDIYYDEPNSVDEEYAIVVHRFDVLESD